MDARASTTSVEPDRRVRWRSGGSCDERRLALMDALDFSDFTPTEFEEFCFSCCEGCPACTTSIGARARRSRRARPTEDAISRRTSITSRSTAQAMWRRGLPDCKHCTSAVPPEALQGLLAWAQAERPHVALVIVSGFLSNAAKTSSPTSSATTGPRSASSTWERPTIETPRAGEPQPAPAVLCERHAVYPDRRRAHRAVREGGVQAYVSPTDLADTAQGWCALCRDVARQQEDELLTLAPRGIAAVVGLVRAGSFLLAGRRCRKWRPAAG